MKIYWQLLRVQQWSKNILVLFGLLFSGQWQNSTMLLKANLAMLAFCLMASSIYILNDLCDRPLDRVHPKKQQRPIASGRITIHLAITLLIILACGSLLLAWIASPISFSLILGYGVLMTAYSKWLKHLPVIDILVIATGFLLRILVGTLGIGITPSVLLLCCTFLLALFLVSCKRRAELFNTTSNTMKQSITRISLLYYSPKSLDILILLTAICLVFSYSYYTWKHSLTYQTPIPYGLMYTIPIVLGGLGRCYHLLYTRNIGEDLTIDFFFDSMILGLAAVWLVMILCILP